MLPFILNLVGWVRFCFVSEQLVQCFRPDWRCSGEVVREWNCFGLFGVYVAQRGRKQIEFYICIY